MLDLLSKISSPAIRQKLVKIAAPATWAVVIITMCSFGARYYQLGEPMEVVFDEVHFGGFTNSYLKGTYFFDIHPPLAKLLLYSVARIIGYDGHYNFKQIGGSLADGPEEIHYYYWLRALPAFFGSLLAPVAFFTVRALRGSVLSASIAAVFIAFENMHFLETRLILTDALLFFGMALTTLCTIHLFKQKPFTPGYWKWLVYTGFALGWACAVKWTAFGLIPLVGLTCVVSLLKEDSFPFGKRNIKDSIIDHAARGLILLGIPFIIHTICYFFHFQLLYKSGEGDPFHSAEFLKTLEGSQWYGSDKIPLGFWGKYGELQERMYGANTGIVGDHAWGTKWHTWLTMGKGVSYWVKYNVKGPETGENGRTHIYLMGNVFIFYMVLFALLAFVWYIVKVVLRKRGLWFIGGRVVHKEITHVTHSGSIVRTVVTTTTTSAEDMVAAKAEESFISDVAFIIIGYCFNLLPYIGVKRVCFLYHYCPALYQGILLFGRTFDVIFPQSTGALQKKNDDAKVDEGSSTTVRLIAFSTIIVLSVGCFAYFAPLTYGWWMPDAAHEARKWSSDWV